MNMQSEIIKTIIDYIEKNLASELNLDNIAEKSGYSKFHLHRMFCEETGMTMHKYIVKRRITEGAKKLVYSDIPIIDIAALCGYESQQAFTNAFKKIYKVTPLIYRLKKEFYPVQKVINITEYRQNNVVMRLVA